MTCDLCRSQQAPDRRLLDFGIFQVAVTGTL
jgi:hypothetical protein